MLRYIEQSRALSSYTFPDHYQEMSYNNYLDADAAWNCVSEFKSPTCVIVKHTNPCGVASRQDILEAYRLAVKADPVSAFGGIVAFNTTIDEVRRIYNVRMMGLGNLHLFTLHRGFIGPCKGNSRI